MKTIIITILMAVAATVCHATEAIIRGTFANLDEGSKVYLVYSGFFRSNLVPPTLSTPLHDGRYEFKVDIDHPVAFHIETARMTFYVVAEPGLTVECRESEILTPAPSQEAYNKCVTETCNAYNRGRVEIYRRHKDVVDRANDEVTQAEARQEADYLAYQAELAELLESKQAEIVERIRTEPSNLWNIVSLASFAALSGPSAETFQLFAPSVQQSLYGRAYQDRLGTQLRGRQAPAFELPDTDGATHTLAQLLEGHRFLLIDFWASWCKPCRKGIPGLKEAYKQYHDAGLQIVSISVDSDEAAWLKAVGEEQMPWPQLHDGINLMSRYGVEGIPSLFLIRADGSVVFEKLYGDAVLTELKKTFEGK